MITQDDIELLDILSPHDWFLWTTFHDMYPSWKIARYEDRPIITNHKYVIEGRTLEVAINAAKKQILYDTEMRKYYRYCSYCGRY